jgi:hypothetical protein
VGARNVYTTSPQYPGDKVIHKYNKQHPYDSYSAQRD